MSDQSDDPKHGPALTQQKQAQQSRCNRRYAAVALVVVGALGVHFALLEYPLIRRAMRQPECDWDASVPWMVSMIVLAVLCALGATLVVRARSMLRRTRNGVLFALLIAVCGSVFGTAYSTRLDYSLVTLNSSNLRSVFHARMAAQGEGSDDPATILVLLHNGIIGPDQLNFPNTGCGRDAPPLPPDLISYHAVTFEDIALRRVSREQLIDAANRALADDPWESIGSMRVLRDWNRRALREPDLVLAFNIITFAREQRAMVLHADGTTESWHATRPDLADKLSAAIAAAEAAGVASPPEELVSFVRESTGAMKRR